MLGLSAWDLALVAAASYVAIVTLARMMQNRRDVIIDQLVEQVAEERQKVKSRKKKARRERLKEASRQKAA
jgi:hypothetical protein